MASEAPTQENNSINDDIHSTTTEHHRPEKDDKPIATDDNAEEDELDERPMFSFEVKSGDDINWYKFLCKKSDGQPIKIGEGSFGAVFKVRGGDMLPSAVKILYEKSRYARGDGNNKGQTLIGNALDYEAALSRFRHEKVAMEDIHRALKAKLDKKEIGAIVLHKGYTEDFKKKELEKALGNVTLSTHALVLDYYHGTLKDLLENKNRKNGSDRVTGYESLRQMDLSERISTILPFLRDVANGLSTMHEAGYVHLDIKPANLFYKNSDGDIKAAIGDLGYIRKYRKPKPIRTESEAALGSLHYRSPEQRDFMDTCEVEIPEQGDDSSVITLLTVDPKFSDTIIEAGDNLQFFKFPGRDYTVKSIKKINDSVTEIQISNPPKTPMRPEEGAQVKIFKNQGVRTDIYGFGAIAYDLIMHGKSPERLYSYLAIHDRDDSSVDEIINNYIDIENYSKRSSKFSSVFELFHDQDRHVPSSMVSLILKCMLYHMKGTYYDDKKERALEAIKEDLVELQKNYKEIRDIKSNRLISGKISKNKGSSETERHDLRKDIISIQTTGIRDNEQLTLLTRIYRSVFIVDKLIELVNKADLLQEPYLSQEHQGQHKHNYKNETEKNHTKFFFAELSPQLISVVNSDELDFKSPVYYKMSRYIHDLWANKITGKLMHHPLEPYSPHDILGEMRRKIKLDSTDNPDVYAFQFKDESSMLGDNIKAGDWIVEHQKWVRRINNVSGDKVILSPSMETNVDEMNKNSSNVAKQPSSRESIDTAVEIYYYRNLDPMLYYLSMLGIYIYQLFFVDLGNNSVSMPSSVKSVKAQLEASPTMQLSVWSLVSKSLNTEAFSQKINMTQRISRLYRRLTALYLVLSLPDQKKFLNKHKGDRNATEMDSLRKIWNDIREDIAECLERVQGRSFVNHNDELFKRELKLLKSHKIDDQKLQLNLSAHFKNILQS